MKYMFDFGSTCSDHGDHFERYSHLDGLTFEAANDTEAERIVSKYNDVCEGGLPDNELWGTDCCIFKYVYRLNDNGEAERVVF